MSCLIVLAKKNITDNGGVAIPSTLVLTKRQYNHEKDKISKTFGTFGFTKNDKHELIHKIFNSYHTFKRSFIMNLLQYNKETIMNFFSTYGNLADRDGNTIAHRLAFYGYKFSIEEIIQLNNIANNDGSTIAHEMALKGFIFPTDDLIKLGNPSDKWGNTVAHYMAWQFHPFSVKDLLKLNNPQNNLKETVAHEMAKRGIVFFVDDILKLGNTPNYAGRTISMLMQERNYEFTPEEQKRLQLL